MTMVRQPAADWLILGVVVWVASFCASGCAAAIDRAGHQQSQTALLSVPPHTCLVTPPPSRGRCLNNTCGFNNDGCACPPATTGRDNELRSGRALTLAGHDGCEGGAPAHVGSRRGIQPGRVDTQKGMLLQGALMSPDNMSQSAMVHGAKHTAMQARVARIELFADHRGKRNRVGTKVIAASTVHTQINETAAGLNSTHALNLKGRVGVRRRRDGAGNAHLYVCRHPEGCSRSASFGEVTSETRLFCARHREVHHEDKKHKLCSVPRCRRQGSFRMGNASGQRVCATHSDGPRVSVGASMCTADGCNDAATHAPRPLFDTLLARAKDLNGSSACSLINENTSSNTTTSSKRQSRVEALWCGAHCPEDAVDVRTRLCKAVGCQTQASHGPPGGTPIRCSRHRQLGDVDRRHKRCQYVPDAQYLPYGTQPDTVKCDRQPTFGEAAEGIARFCAKHRGTTHVDVRSRLCRALDCRRVASFGVAVPQSGALAKRSGGLGGGGKREGVALFCKKHKDPAHVNLKFPPHTARGSRAWNAAAHCNHAGELDRAARIRSDTRSQALSRTCCAPSSGGRVYRGTGLKAPSEAGLAGDEMLAPPRAPWVVDAFVDADSRGTPQCDEEILWRDDFAMVTLLRRSHGL